MTELTHHDVDDGFHEIQLSGKQLVFAFMLTATVAVFIFLLGVQVGRNAKTTARVDDTVDTAAQAPSAVGAPSAQPTTPPSPPASPVGESPARPEDKFSYPALAQDKTPQDKLNAKAVTETPPPATAAPARNSSADPSPVTKEAAKETPKTAAAADHPAPEKPAASGARPGVWVVQLVALKDRAAASAVVQRLSAKGYPAFVVSPAAGKPSIYRVQVGRYNDRREAEQIAKRLEKEEQFKPWISH